MNKAITDGLVLMPPAFADGLDVWSSGDGTPGSDTYAGSGTGVLVPADQNFGGCLEILKTQSVTKLRYMGETTILPGCYLRISAKVKAVGGALPSVRIAGWPGAGGGAQVPGLVETGPAVQLTTYGEVVEVSAILGTGLRTGVDMVWADAIYGHLGLDLTGPNGGIVRVDDIVIEDVTNVFIRDMMGVVDVRDYGAIGDGIANDAAAFEAADADAQGREVLISAGTYFLNNNVTFQNQVRFEGTVTMPVDKRLIFQKNFDYATYLDAFGNEEEAFKKAYQALLNYTDHESLDLGGRRIALSAPVDMFAAEGTKNTFATRRVIRNGQFQPITGPNWDDDVVTSQATYAASSPKTLTGVANVANIQKGSLVTGNGVGREIYVKDVNVGAQTITLSNALFDAEGTQNFTFTRFKYLLDFSGYDDLSQFVLDDIEFQCNGKASGIMLAPQGLTFHLRDCFVTKPKDRGITSIGGGCQGMMIDRCQFLSNEQSLLVSERKSIAFNVNANDVKVRDNRMMMFEHFCVLGGTGALITGNHLFSGDTQAEGVRKGGIIFTTPNVASTISGNYIDNNFVEWTNEHDATPALGAQFSFGGLSLTGNIFLSIDVADWFKWIVIKPYGENHFIHGLSVVGNVFRAINGYIDRVEGVDTTYADLDFNRMRNVVFSANTFHGVRDETLNPLSIVHDQATADRIWIVDTQPYLPFGGWARTVESCVTDGRVADENDDSVYDAPWMSPAYASDKTQFRVIWKVPVTGKVRCSVRMDNPI
ncbi:MAG: hypothetical protein COB65_06640 [Thalassobium sp.]|nr:MAG: hypothetical protein COB65_06640 [Thalassobium sp.]